MGPILFIYFISISKIVGGLNKILFVDVRNVYLSRNRGGSEIAVGCGSDY